MILGVMFLARPRLFYTLNLGLARRTFAPAPTGGSFGTSNRARMAVETLGWIWSSSFPSPSISIWAVALAVGVGLLGCMSAIGISRRSSVPGVGLWIGLVIMWASYLGPTIILAFLAQLHVTLPHWLGVYAFSVAVHLLVLAAPWPFFVGRADRQMASSTAYGSLTYRPLPFFTLRRQALTVLHQGEVAFPVEQIGPRKLELVDGILWVISQKRMVDIEFWRCGAESDERLLLLIDRRVGWLRHVWCLIEVHQLGSGADVNIKLHQLAPRHVDWLDLTLLRYLAFPVAAAIMPLNAMAMFGGAASMSLVGNRASLGILFFVSLVAVLFGCGWAALGHEAIAPAGILFGVGVCVCFVLYVLEANEPNVIVARASNELGQMVQGAIMTAITPLRRPT
jgi:hypothetical protein